MFIITLRVLGAFNKPPFYGSNHEKMPPGERLRYYFMSRRGRTANKMVVEENGGKGYNAKYFKGRKPKTFRDQR